MSVPGLLMHLFRQEPKKLRLLRSLALGTKGGDRTLASADGTALSARCTGRGDPIVCVHGTVDGISAFSMLELEMAERHAVWVYDRRGRGGSGDTEPYAAEREVEDLRAVAHAAGGRPHVVGHSFGAYLALRAAVEGMAVRSLVLYEPPLNTGHIDAAAVGRCRGEVERGELREALRTMAVGLAGVAPEQVDVAMAVPPIRKKLLDGIRTAPREVEALQAFRWPDGRLPLTGVPTLFLRGERSTAPVYPAAGEVSSWADGAEVEVLAGQDHLATSFAPHDLATRILGFVGRH